MLINCIIFKIFKQILIKFSFQHVANCDNEQKLWIFSLRTCITSQLQENNHESFTTNQSQVEQQSQVIHQTQTTHQPQIIHPQITQSLVAQPLQISQNNVVDTERRLSVMSNYADKNVEKLSNHMKSALIIPQIDIVGNVAERNFQNQSFAENTVQEEPYYNNYYNQKKNSPPAQQIEQNLEYYQNRPRLSSTISDIGANRQSFENHEESVDPVYETPIDFNSYYTSGYTHGGESLNFESPVPPEIPLDQINLTSQNFSALPSNGKPGENKNLSDFNDIGTSAKTADNNNLGASFQNTNKGGLFSSLKNRFGKIIPSNNSMILPDDTNPSVSKTCFT